MSRFAGRASIALFFGMMMLATFLTLVRGFAVAALIDPAQFGTYATAVATGTFCGMIASFGTVERTRKHYPRLWARGRGIDTVPASRIMERTLLIRIASGTVLVALAALAMGGDHVVLAVLVGAFALSVTWVSAGSSFLRASGDLKTLGIATLTRSVAALLLGASGAALFAWGGAVLGEVLAAMVFVGVVAWFRRRIERTGDTPAPSSADGCEQGRVREGRILFVATLLVSAPIYLDRLFVREVMGEEAVGTYGFLMLFNVGAAALAGIVAQKAGPDIIRLGAEDGPRQAILRHMAKWVGATALVLIAGMTIMSFALLEWPFAELGAKYGLTVWLMAAVGSLCVCQAFVLLDWVLISTDREWDVMKTSTVFFVGAALMFLVAALLRLDILVIILMLTAAKAHQIAYQLYFIFRR